MKVVTLATEADTWRAMADLGGQPYRPDLQKGVRLGDCPWSLSSTRFEVVIDLKTAEALRLAIPQSIWFEQTKLFSVNRHSVEEGHYSMNDLERLGLALVGFALAVVAGGVLLGLIGAWIKKAK
jgi:hypothetical protein